MALLDLGRSCSPAIAPVVRAGDLPFTAIAPEALSRASWAADAARSRQR